MKIHRPKAAFSLIEILAVLGLVAVFMTLISFHIVGLANVWLANSDDDFFEHHVDGVTLFLSNAIDASEPEPGGSTEEPSLPVEWARPPGFSDLDDPLLYFRQAQAPALFVREGGSLPEVNVYIVFDKRDGLSLLWYSNLDSEDIEDTRDLSLSPVSSFVSKLEYAYYDREDDDWEISEDPEEEDNGSFILPNFLRLTFSYPDEDDIVRTIFIPQRNIDVPLF